MHTGNKLASHGKQVSADARSQMPGVNQQQQKRAAAAAAAAATATAAAVATTAATQMGSKVAAAASGAAAGGRGGGKANQIPQSSPGLKASGGGSGGGSGGAGMLKIKSKRSVSVECGESRGAAAPAAEPDSKGDGVMRSKRRCVLAKKQPYSGDEWCSGPETDDDDKPRATVQRERGLATSIQGLSERLSAGKASEPAGANADSGAGTPFKPKPPQPPQQKVYVFSTSLANSAAEAVIKGQSDSILQFHQQNVQKSKLDQSAGKLPILSEKTKVSSSSPVATPKSQSGTPRPASAGAAAPAVPPSSAGHSDADSPQSRLGGASYGSRAAGHRPNTGTLGTPAGPDMANRDSPGNIPCGSLSALSTHLQSDLGQIDGLGNADGLSKEQLEHRERSLQTLRDIERLFLRGGPAGGAGDPGVFNQSAPINPCNLNSASGSDRGGVEDTGNGTNNPANCTSMLSSALMSGEAAEKYKEPLQSMIAQTQSLGGPGLDGSQMDPSLPPHPMSSPGNDMGPLLMQEGLTREQVAWRKLQEEYYQEKRRQQDLHSGGHPPHFRMMAEPGVHGEPVMMRGPPPPYHSKPGEQQWSPAEVLAGGMGGNGRMLDMPPDGSRGPRFHGQMQRAVGGFPGGLPMETLGHHRHPRQGVVWLDDAPNSGSGGGVFHNGYPGRPQQHVQNDPELLMREEMFRIMEKRQMHGMPRYELERLAKQHQQQLQQQQRLMESMGGPDFPNLGIGRGPPAGRVDPIDFPDSHEMMDSPGAQMADSPLGCNVQMSMNPQMSVQQQQQMMMLQQRLKGVNAGAGALAEMFAAGEISRVSQNGRGGNKGMAPGPFQFPTQSPFPGGQADGSYLQQPGHEMFGPDQASLHQMRGTSRLSHMPLPGGPRGLDLASRLNSDIPTDVNPLASPTVPSAHSLKSPSFSQEPSPLLPSPSAPVLKSPLTSAGHHHPPPSSSGAGTPNSSSIKSPQVMCPASLGLHSPSASPGHLKSPAMAMGSPGWASPKTTLPSPGGPHSGKVAGGGGGGGPTEAGQPIPPRSSNSTPVSQPGSMNPSATFTSSPDGPTAQNPLTLIMSQMSKYAVPSSTPLYHDAIKTIATSDDEMLPDRPLLSGVSIRGNLGNTQSSQGLGPHSDPQSPIGLVGQSQLPHDSSGPVLSPQNQMGMPSMNTVIMGGAQPGKGQSNSSPVSQNQMAGFPRLQPPPHGSLHSPVRGMPQGFPQPTSNDIQAHQQLHLLSKGHPAQRPFHRSDSFASLPMSEGPDLSEVIRPTHTGIPEFDLSRIIPADKPSSTLQYFPKSEPQQGPPPQQQQQLLKQMAHQSGGPSSNPHLVSLQNMAEQQLPSHLPRQSMGIPPGGARNLGPMCPPGHMMGRTGMMPQPQMQQQQAMMPNSLAPHASGHYGGISAPHMMAQQNLMMMQAKQRAMSMPGEPFGHQGPGMAPPHPQSGMMLPQSLRQRGMSLEGPVGYGSGGLANMPF